MSLPDKGKIAAAFGGAPALTLMRLLFSLLLILLLGLGFAAMRMVESEPLVTDKSRLTPDDLRRARTFLNQSLRTNQATTLILDEADLALLSSYLLNQFNGGSAKAKLSDSRLNLQVSIGLPESFSGSYLNLDIDLLQTDTLPILDSLQIGQLVIPAWLADPLLKFLHTELQSNVPDYTALITTIHSYGFHDDQLELEYQLQAGTLEVLANRGRDLLVSPQTGDRLLAHSAMLTELLAEHTGQRSVSLTEIMRPMFEFASSRKGDPVEENRAAILVMALKQLDIDVSRLLQGEANPGTTPAKLHFTLHRRRDFAQHFLGSAALAISTEPGIADSIGLLKEIEDTKGAGSGFSFADLAADRSGIRFGELAVADEASAFALQNQLRAGHSDDFLMDDFRDLPEFLDAQEFSDTYTNQDSPAYKQVMSQIESRIAETPLFQLFQ